MLRSVVLIPLSEATGALCGGKAASLGVLLRAGFSVPDGFVVPFGASGPGLEDVARELARLGDPLVAVRSSAAGEDSAETSAAGQYESILGVRGADNICNAIAACKDSAHTDRAVAYREQTGQNPAQPRSEMAVIVQRLVHADVSGVMFTPEPASGTTRIEASWGLGTAVVGGALTPDAYEVDGDGAIRMTIGQKDQRSDAVMDGTVATYPVSQELQRAPALPDRVVGALAGIGERIAGLFQSPQDIEWAISNGEVWVLQARPITAALPGIPTFSKQRAGENVGVLQGTPGSYGQVVARVRIVRSPDDFSSVQPGEIIVCPYTDPAWTPLFRIASGVITELGGALSHAAIVAREYGIPAVLGVTEATSLIRDGDRLTLDGTLGTITQSSHPPAAKGNRAR